MGSHDQAPESTSSQDRQNHLHWVFRHIGRMHFERIRSEMSARGLGDVSHPRILFLLLHDPDHVVSSQKELADTIGVSPATVATSLRRMESKGLLRRIPDQEDMRRNHIELTEKGKERVKACFAAFADIDRAMFLDFSEEEKERLLDFFTRIRSNLEATVQPTTTDTIQPERNDAAGGKSD